MTTYIVWPKAIDSDFRAFYPTVSGGETIQAQPAETATHFMVGSSNLTAQGKMAIAAVFGEAVTFPEDFPTEFESDGFGG